MEGNGQNESTLPAKDLFRIGEVSRLTATKQFVLRYWESEFPMLQPVKSPKGAPAVSPSGHRDRLRDQTSALRRRLHDRRCAAPFARQAVEPNGTKGETTVSGAGSNWTPPEKGARRATFPGAQPQDVARSA